MIAFFLAPTLPGHILAAAGRAAATAGSFISYKMGVDSAGVEPRPASAYISADFWRRCSTYDFVPNLVPTCGNPPSLGAPKST